MGNPETNGKHRAKAMKLLSLTYPAGAEKDLVHP